MTKNQATTLKAQVAERHCFSQSETDLPGRCLVELEKTGAIHQSSDSADESGKWFSNRLRCIAPSLSTPAVRVEKMRTATVLVLWFSLRLCVRMCLSRKDAKTPGAQSELHGSWSLAFCQPLRLNRAAVCPHIAQCQTMGGWPQFAHPGWPQFAHRQFAQFDPPPSTAR